MPQLLVSVRNADEAVAALDGGADIIDVKEPGRGPLGRADDEVIANVIRLVGGRRPVSAALGELISATDSMIVNGQLQYVKWGLARCGLIPNWGDTWRRQAERLPPSTRPVAVAYADAERVSAPRVEEVVRFAIAERAGALLIDTAVKDGFTLSNWISLSDTTNVLERCHVAGIPVALAGSLSLPDVEILLPLQPELFALRGAVCDGNRMGQVSAEKVRQFADLIHARTEHGFS